MSEQPVVCPCHIITSQSQEMQTVDSLTAWMGHKDTTQGMMPLGWPSGKGEPLCKELWCLPAVVERGWLQRGFAWAYGAAL